MQIGSRDAADEWDEEEDAIDREAKVVFGNMTERLADNDYGHRTHITAIKSTLNNLVCFFFTFVPYDLQSDTHHCSLILPNTPSSLGILALRTEKPMH